MVEECRCGHRHFISRLFVPKAVPSSAWTSSFSGGEVALSAIIFASKYELTVQGLGLSVTI